MKSAILGGNSAALYGFEDADMWPAAAGQDRLAHFRREYHAGGEDRSNAFYGSIHAQSR